MHKKTKPRPATAAFKKRMRAAVKATNSEVDMMATDVFNQVESELFRLTDAKREAIQAALAIAVADALDWMAGEHGVTAMAGDAPGHCGLHCNVYLPNGDTHEFKTSDFAMHAEDYEYDHEAARVLKWAAWHEAEAKRLRDSIPREVLDAAT